MMNLQQQVFLYEKWLESYKKTEQKGKIKRRKLQKNFCLDPFTWEDEISTIKVAYLMLNFLNLKSLFKHLFWEVASCLSILCESLPKPADEDIILLR